MKKIIVLFITCVAAFAAVNTAACVGCHGKNFEKSAMGKSKIVANMSQEEVSEALLGYKAGTYGGSMKNIMKMQVAKYSEEDLMITGVGKKNFTERIKETSKRVFVKTKKTVKKTVKTNVLLSHKNIVGYKEDSTCWVVDFKTKKSKLLDCDQLESAARKKTHSMVPPTKEDIPNPFVGLLK